MLFVGFCLDEDCNPGGGDCGRPLRLFGYVENGDMVKYLVLWRLGYKPDSTWSKKSVVVRHRMGSITRPLLMYQADVEVQGLAFVQSDNEKAIPLGPTPTELASDDRAMSSLLLAYQMPPCSPRLIEMVDSVCSSGHKL